jgi:hypothetical protein
MATDTTPEAPPAFGSFTNIRDALAERSRVRAQLAAMRPEDNVVREGPLPSGAEPARTQGSAFYVGGTETPVVALDDGARGLCLGTKDYEDPFTKRLRLNGRLTFIKGYLRRHAFLFLERFVVSKLDGSGPVLLTAGPEGDQPQAIRLNWSDLGGTGLTVLLRELPRIEASTLRERVGHNPDGLRRLHLWLEQYGPDFVIVTEPRAVAPAPARPARVDEPDKGELVSE